MLTYIFNIYFFFSILSCIFVYFIRNWKLLNFIILYSLIFSFFFSLFFFFIFENKLKISNFFLIFNFLNIKYFNFLFIWCLDSFSLIFVILTTFILILSVLWSWNYSWNKKSLYIFFLFLDFLLKGCFFAFDIFTFFIFFESILIVILYLIGILGTHERKVKAIYFFYVYTLLGSFLILLALLIIYFEVGSSGLFILNNLNLTFKKQIFLWPLLSLSFLIKIPVFPFHLWLPEAHVEASTLGSVFLAAILLKLGGFGFLKFTIPLLPYASIYYTPLIEVLCCLGFFCCGFDPYVGCLVVVYIHSMSSGFTSRIDLYASGGHSWIRDKWDVCVCLGQHRGRIRNWKILNSYLSVNRRPANSWTYMGLPWTLHENNGQL